MIFLYGSFMNKKYKLFVSTIVESFCRRVPPRFQEKKPPQLFILYTFSFWNIEMMVAQPLFS